MKVTSARVVGDAALWAAREGADGPFNITTGDVFRWSHGWPKLAGWFGLEVGEPQPISLAQRLPALRPVWRSLAGKHGLAESDLHRIALGAFGDFIFHVQTDAIFDVTKARRAGFAAMNERADEVLLAHLQDMLARKLIPSWRSLQNSRPAAPYRSFQRSPASGSAPIASAERSYPSPMPVHVPVVQQAVQRHGDAERVRGREQQALSFCVSGRPNPAGRKRCAAIAAL